MYSSLYIGQRLKTSNMKWLIAIFLIVPFVTCQSQDQLDAATLLQQAKNVSCAEFTKSRNAVCCNHTSKCNEVILTFERRRLNVMNVV